MNEVKMDLACGLMAVIDACDVLRQLADQYPEAAAEVASAMDKALVIVNAQLEPGAGGRTEPVVRAILGTWFPVPAEVN